MKQTKESIIKKLLDKLWINKKFYKYSESKIDYDETKITSPVDWTVAYSWVLWETGEFISKWWKKVSLEKLLWKYWKDFSQNKYLNIYLSPKNRHFFCFPYDCKIKEIYSNDWCAIIPIFIWIENIFNIEVFHKAILSNATISIIMETKFWDICFIAVWSLNVNHIKVECEKWQIWKKWELFWHFSLWSSVIIIFPKELEILKKDWDKLVIWEEIIKSS